MNGWPLVKKNGIDCTKDDGLLFTKDILASYFTSAFSDIYRHRKSALAFLGTFMGQTTHCIYVVMEIEEPQHNSSLNSLHFILTV